jgi:hypothetical protein
MDGVTSNFSVIVIAIVPIAFECQAYYRLTQKFGYHDILLWVSLVITTLLLICTYTYLFLQIASDTD